MTKAEKLAEKICLMKKSCNDVCNPISTCSALRYAARVIDLGYGDIDEITKDVVAEYDQALEDVALTPDAFEQICEIKRRCGYTAEDRYSRIPVGRYWRLDPTEEVNELAKFIGDYNMNKGSIDERYLPYVQDVARAILDEGWRKDYMVVQEVLSSIEKGVNSNNTAEALPNLWKVLDEIRAKYGLEASND